MVEKLKLQVSKIHWSLAIKAAIFALSWYFLPFWIFLFIGLYFYFVPFFQPMRHIFPFLLLLFFAFFAAPSLWFLCFLGIIFYLLLGIKDLIFINRSDAYEVASLILLFLTIYAYYNRYENWEGAALPAGFLMGGVFYMLFKNILESAHSGKKELGGRTLSGILSLLFIQFALAILFLPMNIFSQTALLFLIGFTLIEIFAHWYGGTLTTKKFFSYISIFFIGIILVLAGGVWSL